MCTHVKLAAAVIRSLSIAPRRPCAPAIPPSCPPRPPPSGSPPLSLEVSSPSLEPWREEPRVRPDSSARRNRSEALPRPACASPVLIWFVHFSAGRRSPVWLCRRVVRPSPIAFHGPGRHRAAASVHVPVSVGTHRLCPGLHPPPWSGRAVYVFVLRIWESWGVIRGVIRGSLAWRRVLPGPPQLSGPPRISSRPRAVAASLHELVGHVSVR